MGYQIINTGTDNGQPKAPKVVKQGHVQAETPERKISTKQIINLLNYINFQDGFIAVNLRHSRFENVVSLQAKPHPCKDNVFVCEWTNPQKVGRKLVSHEFDSISLTHEDSILKLQPDLAGIDESGISLVLSEQYYPLNTEPIEHYPCIGINAHVIQNSAIFKGTLINFSPNSFHVKVSLEPPQTAQWLNSDSNIEVVLSNKDETLYSGECLIRDQNESRNKIILCLVPLKKKAQRFKSKKFRSNRIDTSPLPNISFKHPLTNRFVDLKIADLSGLGFSIKTSPSRNLFLPGLVLPGVEMKFANSFKVSFTAQVIYAKPIKSDKNESKETFLYGLSFINISSNDHLKLLSFLHQASDSNLYINNSLDMDLLWKFLFDSNFIYPEKYQFLQSQKEEIKNTYQNLYSKQSDIARHFTYQENETIASHLAMIRYYNNTWLIHHHASNRRVSFRAGLMVLNQIGLFSNDSYGLYSNHMNYLLCFFRPENKFPNRVFGGAAKKINDSMKCCLESFSYFHFKERLESDLNDSWAWGLTKTDNADLEELQAFYSYKSSGLMLKALDLEKNSNGEDLYKAFVESGLKRFRHLFSLKYQEHLKAIIMVNITNAGLNLSDLTNATTVIVIDQEKLNHDIIEMALSLISAQLKIDDFPVLVYPSKFAKDHSIEQEKVYNLWILDTQYGDKYFNYVNRLTRLI
jgi:hypothetical protein